MSIRDYDAGVQVGIELMRAAVIARLEQAAKEWQETAQEHMDDLRPRDTIYDRAVKRAETCHMYADAVRLLEVPLHTQPPAPEAPRMRRLTCSDRMACIGDVIDLGDIDMTIQSGDDCAATNGTHYVYVSRADGGPTTTETAEGKEQGC